MFVDARVDAAIRHFVTLRLEGRSPLIAQEMAMRTLLDGLYVSRYDIVYSVIEESLWTRLPEEYWPDFAVHLLTKRSIHDILDSYEVSGDFLDRETHQPMLTELLGEISEILDGYEL